MGIDSESDKAASLVIGPTSLGMVRVYVESEGIELPMDFEPAEALEIADELRAAADRAVAILAPKHAKKDGGNGRGAKPGAKPGAKLGGRGGGRRR